MIQLPSKATPMLQSSAELLSSRSNKRLTSSGANDRYLKNYAEFMAEIIKANNISLPKLLSYQEYSYDEKEHKLIILEYPDRK